MHDPHIAKLHYEIGSGEGISYSDPEPVSFQNHLGDFNLRDGKLVFIPTEHFADEGTARQAIEPFLIAWEINEDLKSNVGAIRFKFNRAELIDRDPRPPGHPYVLEAKAGSNIILGDSASFHLTLSKYPEPPKAFCSTPEVEMSHWRWINFRAGKETLQAMSNFVLSVLTAIAGSRKKAAEVFHIDLSVLSKIGDLSTNKGNRETVRKVQQDTSYQELSGSEKQWLEQAVRRIIYRMGEKASGTALTKITLNDLPPL